MKSDILVEREKSIGKIFRMFLATVCFILVMSPVEEGITNYLMRPPAEPYKSSAKIVSDRVRIVVEETKADGEKSLGWTVGEVLCALTGWCTTAFASLQGTELEPSAVAGNLITMRKQ